MKMWLVACSSCLTKFSLETEYRCVVCFIISLLLLEQWGKTNKCCGPWKEFSGGPLRWSKDWSTPPMRRGWESWDCSAWRTKLSTFGRKELLQHLRYFQLVPRNSCPSTPSAESTCHLPPKGSVQRREKISEYWTVTAKLSVPNSHHNHKTLPSPPPYPSPHYEYSGTGDIAHGIPLRADQVKLTHCWFIFLWIKELFIGGNGGKKKRVVMENGTGRMLRMPRWGRLARNNACEAGACL